MGILRSTDIGSLIRRYRLDAGLSQEKVAELVGVSSQQIQKYETGHTTINIIKLQQLAEALKISVPDLFDVASVRQIRLNEVEIQLLESFRKVKNSEMRACILKLVRNINKRVK